MFSSLVLPRSYIFSFFFFNDTATTEIYTLSLHDALPISADEQRAHPAAEQPDAHQPAVHTPRRRRLALAPVPPERLRRQVLGGEPAGSALPRAHGAGALLARSGEAQAALRRGDADHPRGEALARAVPGGRGLRRGEASPVQGAPRLPADRVGDDRRPVARVRIPSGA